MVWCVKCTRQFSSVVHTVLYVFRMPSHLCLLFRHPLKNTGSMVCKIIHCLKIVYSDNHVFMLASFHCHYSKKWIFSNKVFNVIYSTLAVASGKFFADKYSCQCSAEMPPWLSACLVIFEEPSWLKPYEKGSLINSQEEKSLVYSVENK